jgi:hypothetical protein
MNSKYELLTDDTVTVDGKTLYRIRALASFWDVCAVSLDFLDLPSLIGTRKD